MFKFFFIKKILVHQKKFFEKSEKIKKNPRICFDDLKSVLGSEQPLGVGLTWERRSKRAKSSLRMCTNSDAGYVEEMAVKPTISAKRMLSIRHKNFIRNTRAE